MQPQTFRTREPDGKTRPGRSVDWAHCELSAQINNGASDRIAMDFAANELPD
jgi:hypothetical protein